MNEQQNVLLVLSIVVSVALPACDGRKQIHGDAALRLRAATSSVASQVTAAPSAIASAAPTAVEPPSTAALSPELRSLLARWFDATNSSDVAQLTDLYMRELVFYGRLSSRSKAIACKRNAHSGASALHEELASDPISIPQLPGRTRIEFVKRAASAHKSDNYEAYLVVGSHEGKLRIFEESDRTSDTSITSGPCEYVMRRTLQEFLGKSMPGIDGFTTLDSPEAETRALKYHFMVGMYSDDKLIFHNGGRVRVDPATGGVEYDCSSNLYQFPLCQKLAPGVFHRVPFTPSLLPSADPACAALVQRLQKRQAAH